MSRPKSGLGRGLGAIIPTDVASNQGGAQGAGLRELPIGEITPNEYQPREHFEEESLDSLTESIRSLGVLQPILVRAKSAGGWELIAGERRWRAAQRAGLETIPAVIRTVEDQGALEQALVENLHRSDLNAIEEAHAYAQLMDDFGLTQEQVSARVGKSRSAVANGLRLLNLPPDVQALIIEGHLSAGHARTLLAAPEDEQSALAATVVAESMTVRELEDLIRSSKGAGDADDESSLAPEPEPGTTPPAAYLELEALLGSYLDTRVKVSPGAKKGRIAIDFADIDDLERIFRLMVD